MNKCIWLGAVAALALAGCGEGDTGNATNAASGSSAAPIAAPAGADWTTTVTKTAEGGFLVGNPNAPVKLVEYLSLTCSHCAEFAETGFAPLMNNYVKKGTVSFEIRNYVRDPIDVAGALITRCNGAEPYVALTEQALATQAQLFQAAQGISQSEMQRISALPPGQQFQQLADKVGLDEFAQQRGVSADQANACLADKAALDELVKMQQAANELQIPGTPAFLINGELVTDAGTWQALEPKLVAAGA